MAVKTEVIIQSIVAVANLGAKLSNALHRAQSGVAVTDAEWEDLRKRIEETDAKWEEA